MTKDEIVSRTATDYNFAMEFAVDNNLYGVVQALNYNGYTGGSSREWALSTLKGLFLSGGVDKVKKIFDQTRYINGADNYTGGLQDYFLRGTPPDLYPTEDPNYRLSWNGLLSALGTGLSTYAAATAPANATANAVADQAAADAAAKKEEEEKEKTRKTWIIVGISAGALILITVLVVVFKNRGKGKSKE